jgi:hypothetical protein
MTLEEANTIDIITKPQDGRVGLFIVDAGITTDLEARFLRLMAKLKTYVAFVMSGQFKQEHPDIGPADVTIHVVCFTPPTQQMLQIQYAAPKGDQQNQIPVVFEEQGQQQ